MKAIYPQRPDRINALTEFGQTNSAPRRGISAIRELSQAWNARMPTLPGSSGTGLNPTGKRMPNSSSPKGQPDLLDEDQEVARPQGRPMNSSGRPHVVGRE